MTTTARKEGPSRAEARDRNELLEALEEGRMPEPFGHREHVQAAWLFLRRYPLDEAIARCRRALSSLAERAGKPERYHETITWAYLLLTHDRMRRADAPTEWEAFARRFPEMLAWRPGILDAWYRPETLWSDEARTTFVLPDPPTGGERAEGTDDARGVLP